MAGTLGLAGAPSARSTYDCSRSANRSSPSRTRVVSWSTITTALRGSETSSSEMRRARVGTAGHVAQQPRRQLHAPVVHAAVLLASPRQAIDDRQVELSVARPVLVDFFAVLVHEEQRLANPPDRDRMALDHPHFHRAWQRPAHGRVGHPGTRETCAASRPAGRTGCSGPGGPRVPRGPLRVDICWAPVTRMRSTRSAGLFTTASASHEAAPATEANRRPQRHSRSHGRHRDARRPGFTCAAGTGDRRVPSRSQRVSLTGQR